MNEHLLRVDKHSSFGKKNNTGKGKREMTVITQRKKAAFSTFIFVKIAVRILELLHVVIIKELTD